jgi:hypothetical protein
VKLLCYQAYIYCTYFSIALYFSILRRDGWTTLPVFHISYHLWGPFQFQVLLFFYFSNQKSYRIKAASARFRQLFVTEPLIIFDQRSGDGGFLVCTKFSYLYI